MSGNAGHSEEIIVPTSALSFSAICQKSLGADLRAIAIETLQVNIGLKCNLACHHCHLESSPAREEEMDWPTMESGLEAGYVESRRLSDTGSVLLSGWVADLERGRPALRVLVFRRGRLILSTQPGGPREDVARARSLPFDLDLAFTVEIPAAESGDEEVAVTMIAVLEDGRAVLLPRLFASAE